MQIFLIILISVLIGLFVIDIILGFISGVIDSKKQAELEQRLCNIELLLCDCTDEYQDFNFNFGGNNENIN